MANGTLCQCIPFCNMYIIIKLSDQKCIVLLLYVNLLILTYLVAGRTLLTNKNIAFSGGSWMRFRMMYMNWATKNYFVKNINI